MSVDGVTYSQVATLGAPLRQGFLTSSLPAAAGWDAVDTLAVNLAESGGTLSGTSQAAAQQGGTLSLVDNEFLGYEVATLTTGFAYNLTGLARGLGGSSTTSHSTGAPFARLDGAVGRFDLPANLAGKMLFFKFQSFNTLGGGLQDLSTCTVYTFATTAPASPNPIFAQLQTGFPLDLGQVVDTPTLADDFGLVAITSTASLDLGAIVVSVIHPIAAQLLLGSPVDLGLLTSAVTLSDDFGSTMTPLSMSSTWGRFLERATSTSTRYRSAGRRLHGRGRRSRYADTTNNRLRLNDGVTLGGAPHAKLSRSSPTRARPSVTSPTRLYLPIASLPTPRSPPRGSSRCRPPAPIRPGRSF